MELEAAESGIRNGSGGFFLSLCFSITLIGAAAAAAAAS